MIRHYNRAFQQKDLASWNFIIFLTLAFILLVVVLNAMTSVNKQLYNLRSQAAGKCQAIQTLPRPEDCAGGWTYQRGTDGCPSFICR